MNRFIELKQDEELEIQGGAVLEAILAAATILGGYAAIREIVKDVARNEAWKDLKKEGSI